MLKGHPSTNFGLPFPNREASYKSLGKYCKAQPLLDEVAWEKAQKFLRRAFAPQMRESLLTSYDDAVKALDMNSSPGFPWTQLYRTKAEVLAQPWFKPWVLELFESDGRAEYPVIWVNSLKEEIRPLEKIEANSIRTFTASPLHFTILGSMLFSDMNEKFYASHLVTPSAVGLNPFRGGWDHVWQRLTSIACRHGVSVEKLRGMDFDATQYDSSLFQRALGSILEFRKEMYAHWVKGFARPRANKYYQQIIWSVIVTIDGLLVRKQTGNPSGSANTIVDNTLILFLLFAYVYIIVIGGSYDQMMEDWVLVLCGDDNTCSISPTIADRLTPARVISELAKVGLTVTTDHGLDWVPVEQLSFVSSDFSCVIWGKRAYRLAAEKLLESLRWSEQPNNPVMSLIRATAIWRVGWTNLVVRDWTSGFINFLVNKYGRVLANDRAWRGALNSLLGETDMRLFYVSDCRVPMDNQRSPDKSKLTMVAQGANAAAANAATNLVKLVKQEKKLVGQLQHDKQSLRQGARNMKMVARARGHLVKGGGQYGRSECMLLRAMLDPERFGPSDYPDAFGGAVTHGKFIINHDVDFDQNGDFSLWANPTLASTLTASRNPVGVNQRFASSTTWSVGDAGNLDAPGTQYLAAAPNYSNLKVNAPSYFVAGTSFNIPMSARTRMELPTGYTAAQLTLAAGATASIGPVAFRLTGSSGIIGALVPGTPLVIPTGLTFIQLEATTNMPAPSSTDWLRSCSFFLDVTPLAGSGQQYDTFDVPDFVNLTGASIAGGNAPGTYVPPLYEEYRCTAMSMLVSFRGNTLYDGGNIAGRYLTGGESPESLDVSDYTSLANLPGSFDNGLRTGAYCIWKPTDVKDMEFRPVSYDNTEASALGGGIAGSLPSIYVAGRCTDPLNSQVRVRLVINVEAKTSRQLLVTHQSRVAPEEVAFTMAALQSFPMVVENPLHLDAIKNFLGKALKKGEEVWHKWEKPARIALDLGRELAPLLFAV